jgi:hypothetical protein
MTCALAALGIGGGACAPREFEKAEIYFARSQQVTDASVRRLSTAWEYRVNDELLARLEEAESEPDPARKRELASQALRQAGALASSSAAGEIERLPRSAQLELARRAGCAAEPALLAAEFQDRVGGQLAQRMAWLDAAGDQEIDRYLRGLIRSAEPKPDDRGRAWRVALLSWGAIPAWSGVRSTQHRLDRELPLRLGRTFQRCAVFVCAPAAASDALSRNAPVIVQELQPDHLDADRFGLVFLEGQARSPTVRVDPEQPAVYAYTTRARLSGAWHDQLVYVWWYPRRPAMTEDDPAAGDIDGSVLRITLDAQGRPAIFEVLGACGCGHLVFVSEGLEQQAALELGGPLPGRSYAVQRGDPGGRRVTVAGIVCGPVSAEVVAVYVESGFHSVIRLAFGPPDGDTAALVEQAVYQFRPYDELERLPLGATVASMFGADGLVHNAGRKEGWLLAPTGMLSAGQPRQRGTQKIHWDADDLDDPDLLDHSLRLPAEF